MKTITSDQFKQYADEGYNLIPVAREVLADLDTPLSVYMKVANEPYTYLLESVQGGEKWGRYSFIGLSANTVLRVCGQRITIEKDFEVVEEYDSEDPLKSIEAFQKQFVVPEIGDLPRFTGGLVGYFGYETIQYIEPRLANSDKDDPLGCPDIMLLVSERVVVFDNVSGKLLLIVHAVPGKDNAYREALAELDRLEDEIEQTRIDIKSHDKSVPVEEDNFVSGFTQDKFEAAVEKIKGYIIEGDVMQAVPSQRLSIPFSLPPINLYRCLRTMNPSPYMYYFNLSDFYVVGASPEILVRLEDNIITVRPLAGTRKRGKDEAEDKALEVDLLADPKEVAEHLMLIDLGRNDVGRVSQIGSVKLTENMIVERYSHVMHIVSNVTGIIDGDKSAIDVLRATFPAGTLSGAPKIRAMEIINELEPVKRGVYAGAVGYLSWDGNMDTAIAIRTAVIKDDILHIQAGAGIVADSVPRKEWEETMSKGRAVFHAAAMAQERDILSVKK
jgi:anthranilate synthase component 1